MYKYYIYVWHPLFKQLHEVEADNVYDAIDIVRDRYNVTDDRHKRNYHISSIIMNDITVARDIMLYY